MAGLIALLQVINDMRLEEDGYLSLPELPPDQAEGVVLELAEVLSAISGASELPPHVIAAIENFARDVNNPTTAQPVPSRSVSDKWDAHGERVSHYNEYSND